MARIITTTTNVQGIIGIMLDLMKKGIDPREEGDYLRNYINQFFMVEEWTKQLYSKKDAMN